MRGLLDRAYSLLVPVVELCVVCAATVACVGGDGGQADVVFDSLPGGIPRVVSGPAAGWPEAQAWRLEEELRIGTAQGEGSTVFAGVRSLATDADGRLYVLETRPPEVRVFDDAGNHLHTFGREGEGPGEFASAAGLAIRGDGTVWVVDGMGRSYVVFDREGAFLFERPRTVAQGIVVRAYPRFDANDQLLELVGRSGSELRPEQATSILTYQAIAVRLDPDALDGPADSIVGPVQRSFMGNREQPGGGGLVLFALPFSPASVEHIDVHGNLWVGQSDEYRLVRLRASGDSTLVIERNVSADPVVVAERDSVLASLARRGLAHPSLVPETRPYFSDIQSDPAARIWVRRYAGAFDAGEPTRFDVFDPDGAFLGQVTAPYELSGPLVIGEDGIWALTRGDFDVPYVVRLRIVRP